LEDKNVPSSAIKNLEKIISQGKISLDEVGTLFKGFPSGEEGVDETKVLLSYLASMGIPSENYQFELSLARGLDYYTGPIFETVLPKHPHIGSLTGGGRYDELISSFSGIETPAVGTSLGLDRILSAMSQLGMLEKAQTRTHALVTIFSKETVLDSLKLTSVLRTNGINTEIFHEPVKLKSQLSYADTRGIRFVVILGEDEIQNHSVTLKDMQTRSQEQISINEICARLKKLLQLT
jgi:histidyl-tRNA synthetase